MKAVWYEDRYLFHVLGFVFNQTAGRLPTITELLTDSQALSKHDFSKGLRNRVCWMVFGNDLSAASPDELGEEITNLCRTVDYANAPKVRSLLLLFNQATLLEDPRSNIWFQFDSFKQESWDIDGPDHGLANLTLLDSRTNRGYRNAVFAVKRSILLENDRSGIFVPLCTRNVFLKCYSRTVGNVMFWTEQDGPF